MASQIRVLVVDDDPDILELTATFLGRVRDDLEVETALGGSAGLDALAVDAEIDCVVCDYDMPELDGLEFLRAVRDDDPTLPFILFTGKGSEEIASEAIAAGVTDYLQKNAGNEQYEVLANRVVNAVERRRAERRATNLDRINRVIRRVQRGLVAASTREEIEELVCDEFAAADPYEFAWIGVPGDAGALEPRVTAGPAAEQLRAAIESTDPVTRRKGPGSTAARTGEPQSVQDIRSDPGYAPWRDPIGDAGLRSLGAVPLRYGDAEYGVLSVYAGRPHAFDEEEMTVLAELGDTIGRAIDAAETSRALDFVNEVVEGVSAGVTAYDEHGDFVYVNSAFADILDYSVPELLDTPIWDVEYTLTPANFPRYWSSFEPSETRTVETKFRTADGALVPVETAATPVDIDGTTYHVGTITDITERVESRERLETYARRFEAVFEDPDAFIGLLEPNGDVIQVNDSALSFIDADPEDVEGVPFWETPWWSFDEAIRRDLRERIAAAADGEFVRFEVENRGPRGRSVMLDTIIRPVRDGDGQIVSLLAEGRDVTDRMLLERELRDNNRALQELYTAASRPGTSFVERLDEVLAAGCDHLDLPMAALTQQTEDGTALRILGNRGVDEVGAGDEIPVTAGYTEVLASDERVLEVPDVASADVASADVATGDAEAWGVETYIGGSVTIDGEHVGMLWFAGPESRPGGYEAFDRTFVELLARWASYELEQREANDRLERQNDRLERFAAIITHDLRSPLTTAQGWLELVADEHADDDRIDRIGRALDRMDELIEDVREMTASGKTVTDPQPVSLSIVADAAWSTSSHPDADLRVEPDAGAILGDDSRTRQILENLFRNAIEHAGPDVTIRVGTTTNGFFVADDGPGIPVEDRDTVFDHGYTTTDDGTGFGLNIVAEAAAAHGWQVSVAESESGGARFEVLGVERVALEASD